MILSHNNISLIETWLIDNKLTPSLADDFVRHVYESVLQHRFALKDAISPKTRLRGFSLQYEFVRRDLLKILHKWNNYSASGIAAGYVYAIGNPSWDNFVKIGSAIDVNDRLSSYQTSSPYRDYFIIDYYFVLDRREEETILHAMFDDKRFEWCNVSIIDIQKIFKLRKEQRCVRPTLDTLWYRKDIENSKLNLKKKNWYVVLNIEDDSQ